jgi:hypothetical protein
MGGAPGCGGEGGLPWVGQHFSLATGLLQRDIIGFSATPRNQIAVSQFSLLIKSLTRIVYFAYCHIAYISHGSCKDRV